MSLADSLEGSAFFLPTIAAAVLAAVLLGRRRYPHLLGLSRFLAQCVLATTALLFAHVIPAALGILSRPSALIASVALLAAAWRTPGVNRPALPSEPDSPPSGAVSIAIAVVVVGAAVVYEVARLRLYEGRLPDFIDAVGFHLPGVTTWIQTGSLWRVDQFLPGFATAQYPNNGDFLLLSVVMPWHDLTFARLAMAPFFALTGVGAYALGLELGARRAAAATFASAATTIPYISQYAFDAIPDVVTLSMLAIGLVFVLRYARSRLLADLMLGGLGLGLSFGTKWYGVTSVAAIVVVWLLARLLIRMPARRVAGELAALLATIALGGGIWLLRNLIESGNPIYPKTVKVLGVQLFAGSQNDVINTYGYTIAHYLSSPHILSKYIYPGFRYALGLTGLVLLAGLVIGAVQLLPRRRRRRGRDEDFARAATVLAVIAAICVLYVITPGTAYGPKNLPIGGYPTLRWLMPAVVTGAAVAALAATRLGVAGVLLELAGLVGVIDSIRRGDSVGGSLIVKVIGVLLVLAVLSWLAWRWARRPAPRRSAALAGGVLATLVAAALGIWLLQRHFPRDGYAANDPVFAWIDAHAPSGHRVAISGEAGASGLAAILPLAGPRLGNTVAYVGSTSAHSVELPTSAAEFQAALERGRYDLLEVGLQNTGHADQWARAIGYRLLASSSRLALYGAPRRVGR